MKTLTGSGAGILFEINDWGGQELTNRLLSLVDEYKFVVIKDFSKDLDSTLDLMKTFGTLNNAPTRDKGVLKLDTSQENEVLRSQGALPLHKDGLLTAFDVLLVGIYCIDFKNVSGGRTYVSDSSSALDVIPEEHIRILKEVGFEGLPVDDTGYYARETDKWHSFKAFIPDSKGEQSLHMGMPHMPGEKESWKVRIPTVSPEVSDEMLYNMIRVFSNPPYVYYHDWDEGDLILFDNYKVMHGRERFSGGPRELANIQVVR